MKKITYLILIVIGMVFYTSCSTSEITEEPESTVQSDIDKPEDPGIIDFQIELATLNKHTFTGQPKTRGFRDFMKRFVAIVTCDALGAGFGLIGGAPGVVTGTITASLAAAIAPESQIDIFGFTRSGDEPSESMHGVNDPEIALSPNLIPTVSSNSAGPSIEDSIGYIHNVVVLALNHDIASVPVDLDTLIEKVAEQTYQYYHTTQKEVINHLKANQSLFENIIRNIMPNVTVDNDLSDLIHRCQMLYPDRAEKLRTIEIFIEGLCNIEITDNDGEYLNKALALLNKAAMDATTKRDLRNALIVANASYQLWTSSEK